jgi:hypothetical protein
LANRINQALKQEKRLSEACSSLVASLSLLDYEPEVREGLVSLLEHRKGEGHGTLTGCTRAEQKTLCSLLQNWDNASPFQRFVVHHALQHLILHRVWRLLREKSVRRGWEPPPVELLD